MSGAGFGVAGLPRCVVCGVAGFAWWSDPTGAAVCPGCVVVLAAGRHAAAPARAAGLPR